MLERLARPREWYALVHEGGHLHRVFSQRAQRRLEGSAARSDQLDLVERALSDTLERAGLHRDAIDIVLCTGGSSLIPAVRRILEEHFPGRVVEHDPFTSVAAGLAIASYNDW